MLSAAELRDEARGLLLARGLGGFMRVGARCGPLLVTDMLRRAGGAGRADALTALEDSGFCPEPRDGLVWLSPSEARLRRIAEEAGAWAALLRPIDWESPLAGAHALAVRFMRSRPEPWTRDGVQLLLEALRLPEPSAGGWPEADGLRPPASVLLRVRTPGGIRETGLILAARLARHEEGRHRPTEREHGAILD